MYEFIENLNNLLKKDIIPKTKELFNNSNDTFGINFSEFLRTNKGLKMIIEKIIIQKSSSARNTNDSEIQVEINQIDEKDSEYVNLLSRLKTIQNNITLLEKEISQNN